MNLYNFLLLLSVFSCIILSILGLWLDIRVYGGIFSNQWLTLVILYIYLLILALLE